MTLVKPKSDDQVQGEQTKKRTHRLPRPKHGKRWSLLIVALLLILAFAGKFLLSKGPSAAAITYTEEKVAPRTITNSYRQRYPPARQFLYCDHPDRRRGPLCRL